MKNDSGISQACYIFNAGMGTMHIIFASDNKQLKHSKIIQNGQNRLELMPAKRKAKFSRESEILPQSLSKPLQGYKTRPSASK